MDIARLVIADPSGNTTALVFDRTAPESMCRVAAIIQDEFPSVEQVLFVQKHGSAVHGQMAGGEFCGNAARVLGYVLANGKKSKQQFTMSGLIAPVTVDVGINRAKLEIQTNIRQENRLLNGSPIPIIHLEGISYALFLPEQPLFQSLKKQAARLDGGRVIKAVLDDLRLTRKPACGLLFAENKDNKIKLTPYVSVRDTGTFCAETACASGSIAIASFMNRGVAVIQPSGKILEVTLQRKGNIASVSVDGDMAIKWDGAMTNLGSPPALTKGNRKPVASGVFTL